MCIKMEQIVINALDIIMSRIKFNGQILRHASNEYTVFLTQIEMDRLFQLKKKIEKRFKMRHNVLYVDFQSKKRVA